MPNKTEMRIVSELTYISYAHNRDIAPEVSPERWAKIFPSADILEARYAAERLRERT